MKLIRVIIAICIVFATYSISEAQTGYQQNVGYEKYILGKEYSEQENYFMAEELLREAYSLGCTEASSELGWIYYGADLYRGSIRANTSGDDEAKYVNSDGGIVWITKPQFDFRNREHRYPNDNAIYWFKIALNNGINPNGMTNWYLCNLYTQLKDYKEAAKSLEDFLSAGNYFNGPNEDYLMLADLYYLSETNPQAAFNIYLERYTATKNEDLSSDYCDGTWFSWMACGLGKCYYSGFGVSPNPQKAFELFKESVEADEDAEAMYLLSRCYRFGRGTKQNLKLADEWLSKAKKTSDPNAIRVSSVIDK